MYYVFITSNYKKEYLNQIMEIVADSLGEFYGPDLYENLSRNWRDGFIVSTYKNIVVGFILGVIPVSTESRILMFAVKKEFRGNGIGTMLMNSFIERSANIGVKKISLEVRVSNKIAISLYIHFGFTFSPQIIPKYYSNGEDGYQMIKYL